MYYITYNHIITIKDIAMPKIKIDGYQCCRCQHIWRGVKRNGVLKDPVVCPACRSPYWSIPKKIKDSDNSNKE